MTFKEIIEKYFLDKNVIEKFSIYDNRIAMRKNNLKIDNFINEEWKKIDGFNYEVSNYGRIRNITTLNIKQLKFSRYGNQVILWKNSAGYTFTLSNLVAYYFIRRFNKDNNKVIHIDKNIRNNYVKNLKIINIKKGE